MKSIMTAIVFIALLPALSAAETHPAVQAALDYQVPQNTCGEPIALVSETNVAPPTQDSGSATFFEGSSTASVSDVDSYSRKRLERKERRRKKCVAEYKQSLLRDMDDLKGSAKHGLTEDQAQVILANMAQIQKVYMTPNGVIEAGEVDNSGDSESGLNSDSN